MMDDTSEYPDTPGWKAPGTSQAAAEAISERAPAIRDRVLEYIRQHAGVTADEVAAALGMSVLTIRPRVSELRRRGDIEPTGERFCNSSGMTANAWRVAPPLPGGG